MALVQMRVTASRTVVGGRYRLGERLGEGAAGVVWQAWDIRLGRSVAVKQLVIPPGLAGADARRAHADAAREGRIAARLQHPAVAGMLDMVVEDGSSWLVMEHVDGRSLAEVLERSTLGPLEAARIGAEIADALAVAHAAGVVHSDVKPANVLLREDGTVKLADFGIARVVHGDNLTGPGVLSGTPLFMAPEVARGQWPDGASDVYSLAGTLYAAVEGVGPFGPMDHDEPLAMIRRVAETTPLAPRRAGPLAPVLAALLVADPGARPSAAATRDLLREIVAPGTAPVAVAPSTARPVAAPAPAVVRDRICRAPRRGRALTALSAVGVVGVGAVAGSFGGGTVMSLLTSVAPAPFDDIAIFGGPGAQPGSGTVAAGGPGAAVDDTDAVAAPAVPSIGAPIVSGPGWSASDTEDGARTVAASGTSGQAASRAASLPVASGVIDDVPLGTSGQGGLLSGATSTVDSVVPLDLGASDSGGLLGDLPVRLPVDLGSDDGLLGLPVDLGSDDGLLGLPVELGSDDGVLGLPVDLGSDDGVLGLPVDLGSDDGVLGLPVDLGSDGEGPLGLPVDLGSDGDGPLGLPVDLGSDDGVLGLPVELPLGGGSSDSGESGDSEGSGSGSSGVSLPVDLPVDLPGGLLGGSSSSTSSDSDQDTDSSSGSDSEQRSDQGSDGGSGGAVGSVLSGASEPLSVLSFPSSGAQDDTSSGSDSSDSSGGADGSGSESSRSDSSDSSGSSSSSSSSSEGASGGLTSTVGSVLGGG